MRTSSIPAYGLYGESTPGEGPAFAHIETIAARSVLHDWEIAPHRHHHSVQVLIVAAGGVTVALDGAAFDLAGPCHVTIPVGAVHGFRFEPATHGWVLTLAHAFLARASEANDPLARLLAMGGAGPLAADEARRVALLAQELIGLTGARPDTSLFHALAEALLRSLPSGHSAAGTDDRRLGLFRHLIETHLAEHRPLSFYAASLGLTVRTLHRLCLQHLGCTPLEAINRRLTSEAQRLLRYTNASVAQVAETLGFADASYFSRFYLRMTGRRPVAERAER